MNLSVYAGVNDVCHNIQVTHALILISIQRDPVLKCDCSSLLRFRFVLLFTVTELGHLRLPCCNLVFTVQNFSEP